MMIRWSLFLILVVLRPLGAAVAQALEPLEHLGICDASAAVAVAPGEFLVANDECIHLEESEDCNQLLVYKSDASGKALQAIDITSFMALEKKKKEADLEGSAPLDGLIYWVGSHARNKDGELKKNRHQLFAMEVSRAGEKVVLKKAGRSYTDLLKDLLKKPEFQSLTRERLAPGADKSLAAESEGAINIEGLSAWPGNQLLIGFRNPIPEGRALLVPLENPAELISGQATSARFGAPIRFDLGGRGIRSIEFWEARKIYLIVSGPAGDPGPGAVKPFQLYQWSGKSAEPPREIADADLTGLNPEAIVIYPNILDRFQVLSDDGGLGEGTPAGKCKDLADDNPNKKFRSRWIHLEDSASH